MKKNVLIVNGNEQYSEELRRMVLDVNPYPNVVIVHEVLAAYDYLMNNTIDLFILETVLHPEKPGDISGIRLAEQIRGVKKYALTPMIFVTMKEDPERYAYEELNCLGYFVKPFRIERFKDKVGRGLCYHTSRNEDKALFFRKSGCIYPIRVSDIAYIVSASPGMDIHTADGKVIEVMYKTYQNLLDEADSECLFQCNRSVVVNRNYVRSLDFPAGRITLKNGLGAVEIGRTYKKRIRDEFANYIF